MEATTAAASSAASLSRPKLNQSITESNMSGQKQQNHTRLTNSTKCSQLHAYHMSSRPILVCWTSWRRIWAHEITLSNVTYIVKEPNNRAFISWHQDFTCVGVDGCDQVSAWLALSSATAQSGCMQIIPRSHREGMGDKETAHDPDNVLSQLRTITNEDDSPAVGCELEPSEVS